MVVSKKTFKVAMIFSGIMLISKLVSALVLVGVIGGKDGPTAMFLAEHFIPHMLPQLFLTILPLFLEILAYLFVFVISVKAVKNNE